VPTSCSPRSSYALDAYSRLIDCAFLDWSFKKQVRRILRHPERRYAYRSEWVAEYDTAKGIVIRVVYRWLTTGVESSAQVVTVVRLGKLKGATQRASIDTHHDCDLDVAYVGLQHGKIAETIEAGEGIYYDLDSYGEILGVEIISYSHYGTAEGDSSSIFERLPVRVH